MKKNSVILNNWSSTERHEAKKHAEAVLKIAKAQDKGKVPTRVDNKTVIYK